MQAPNTGQAGGSGEGSMCFLKQGPLMIPLPLVHGAIPAPQAWRPVFTPPPQGKCGNAVAPPLKILQGCAPCAAVHGRFHDALMDAVDSAVNMAQVLHSPMTCIV
jgi:hypothetical protein